MDGQTKRLIAALAVPAFMIGTDFTGAMLLVVPIEQEFGADITTTQWVLNVYALALAMVLVAGGRLGDMFGRRRFLLIGLLVFFLASLACTFAPSVGFLIGARAVQGIGAAIFWPCLLAVAAASVDKDKFGEAMAFILGVVSLGNVVSPFIAGILAGIGEWRWFFLANVILAAVSALMVWRLVARDSDERTDERVDITGMAVLSLAVFGLLYGLDVGADWGWGSTPVIGLFVFCVVMFAAFPLVERRVRDPMVAPPMMKNRQLLLALSMNGLMSPPVFLLLLYLAQYYHKVLGWSVLWSAVGLLPLMVVLGIGSTITGKLYSIVGPQRLLATGYGLAVLSCLWIIMMPTTWGYVGTLVPMVVMALGGGLVFAPAASASVSAADPSRAGLAGGLAYMFHLGLGAIGVGGATAIMYTASLDALGRGLERIGVTMSQADQIVLNAASLHGDKAREILERYGAGASAQIETVLADAFASGFQQAYWLALGFAAVGLVFALALDMSKLHGEES